MMYNFLSLILTPSPRAHRAWNDERPGISPSGFLNCMNPFHLGTTNREEKQKSFCWSPYVCRGERRKITEIKEKVFADPPSFEILRATCFPPAWRVRIIVNSSANDELVICSRRRESLLLRETTLVFSIRVAEFESKLGRSKVRVNVSTNEWRKIERLRDRKGVTESEICKYLVETQRSSLIFLIAFSCFFSTTFLRYYPSSSSSTTSTVLLRARRRVVKTPT